MFVPKNPLTPRETAMRLIEHAQENATYEDLIRQLQILQDIERTMNDIELAGFPGDDVLARVKHELADPPRERRKQPRKLPRSTFILRSGDDDEWTAIGKMAEPPTDSLLDRADWDD